MISEALLLLTAASCVSSIDLTQPESVVVQPGQSLTVTCQVSGYSLTDNSYATGWVRHREGQPMEWIFHRWGGGDFYQNDALKSKFSDSRDTSAGTVTIQGQNMQPEDSAVYYCVRIGNLGYGFDIWGKGTMVTVTTAIATVPQVFPLIPCSTESGATLTFACLATGFSPASLTFSWTKSGTALTDFIQFPAVQEGNTYTGISHIRVKRNDWDNKGNIKCLASNTVGSSQAALVIPEVKYISPTLKLGSSTDDENEVTFSCVAKDFSPKGYNLTWQKNTEQITGQIDQIETVSKGRTGNDTTLYSAASFLTVDSSDWVEGTTYTCLFDGNWGKNAIVVKKTVTYKESEIVCGGCSEADVEINIEGPRIENMSINRKGTLTCEVKVNKGKVEKMFWENSSGNEIADSQIVFGKEKQGTLFHFLDITYDEWSNGTQVACVVYHNNIMEPVKKEYKKSIGEQTKKPAVFMLPPLEHNNKVTLTCFVKDFFPQEVSVSWLVNDEDTGSAYEFKTTSPVESKGAYFVYSHLTLNVAQWSDIDVVYGCVVYHESLLTNTSKSIVRSIGSRTFEKNNVVNFSMNVPNTCNTQ